MHDAYDITFPGMTLVPSSHTRKVWDLPRVKLLSDSSGSGATVYSGSWRRLRLDASHHTTKIGTWRPPTSYFGSRAVNVIHTFSGSCSYSNPSWYTDYVIVAGVFNIYAERDWSNPSPGPVTLALRPRTIQKALRKFRRNAHEEQLDLALAFKERQQTADMATDLINRLWKTALKLERGQWFDAWTTMTGMRARPADVKRFKLFNHKSYELRPVNEVGDRWLTYRYGWKPLLGDIYGACETIALHDVGSYDRYRIKASAKTSVKGQVKTSSNANFVFSNGLLLPATVEGIRDTVHTCRVVLHANRANLTYVRLADVGLGDPLTTAWEALPYSFVVDWFLGVGNFLEAASALNGYNYVGGTCTLHEHRHDTYTGKLRSYSSQTLKQSAIRGVCQESLINLFTRQVLTSDDLSWMNQPIIPNWELPSFTHLFDAAALLGGVFKRWGARRDS